MRIDHHTASVQSSWGSSVLPISLFDQIPIGGELTNPTMCPSGHEIRSAADRNADGWCRQCRNEKNIGYRSRQRAALELALALESHGVAVTRSEPPVDLQQLAADLARSYTSG